MTDAKGNEHFNLPLDPDPPLNHRKGSNHRSKNSKKCNSSTTVVEVNSLPSAQGLGDGNHSGVLLAPVNPGTVAAGGVLAFSDHRNRTDSGNSALQPINTTAKAYSNESATALNPKTVVEISKPGSP